MKKILTSVFLILALFSTIAVIKADEDDSGKDENGLPLDTDVLRNRSDTYNSTTEVGDILLFSTIYEKQLATEQNVSKQEEKKLWTSVFDNEKEVIKSNNGNVEVFLNVVEFKKVEENDLKSVTGDILMIFVVALASVLIVVLVIFRKKKTDGENEDATDNYFGV